jgi:drug/metabolite transporter (DMT)-like permease
MAVLWGIPYLFIRIAVAQVSPVWLVFVRTGLAALVLLPLAARRSALKGLGRRLPWVAMLAAMGVAGPFLAISYGEQRIPSSLSGLLVAAEPLMIAALALRVDASERVGGWRLVGLFLGFFGVICLLGLDIGPRPRLLAGAAMVLLGALGYAGGALLVKLRFAGCSPLGLATAAVTASALALLPAAAFTHPGRVPAPAVLGSLVVLGLACTALGYLAFYSLIGLAGASRASVITYLNPAVAVGLGVAVLGEPVTPGMVAGFVLILAGSWLSTGGRLGWTGRSLAKSEGDQGRTQRPTRSAPRVPTSPSPLRPGPPP